MQHTSTSDSDAPLFATVTFVYSDGSTGSTFRVPITRETTVRRLAKDAMQRLVLSRRVTGQRVIPAIVVTEVFVRGVGPQPKAEVFAQDIVTQVVLVKDEVIFMAVQNQADLEAHPPPATTTTTTTTSSMASAGQANDAVTVAAVTTSSSVPTPSSSSAAKCAQPLSSSSPEAPHTATRRTTTSAAVQTTAAAACATTVAKEDTLPAATKAVPRTRDAAADKATAHTPVEATMASVQMRKRRRGSDVAVIDHVAVGGSSGSKSGGAVSTAAAASATEEMHGGDTIQRLREREMARLGWGPEAHKHFAANYVSSPEKLMRARFTRASRGKAAAAAAATKTSSHDTHHRAAKEVAKHDSAHDAQEHTHTASHHTARGAATHEAATAAVATVTVESETSRHDVAEEDEVQVRLPKGWGPDALRLFPLNYVSSPDRLAREIRQRHKREKAEHKAHDETVVNVDDAEKDETSRSGARVAAVAHKVARQLHFSEAETQKEADSPEGRPTVAHHASLRLNDEAEAADAKPTAMDETDKGKTVHFAAPVLTAQEFLRTRGDNRAIAHTQ